MRSIGIMSMQRILNYGSSLQAYALRRLIESFTVDARVKFVDYRPGTILEAGSEGRPSNSPGLARAIAKVSEYNQTGARFADRMRFFNHKRRYARRYFPLVGIPAERDYDLDLDVQVIGSDEVFNCVQRNRNVGYSRDLFGHKSSASRLVSYAGSFGNTTMAKIEAAGIREDLEEDFARFAALSVRDRNSAEIIESLTGVQPVVSVDPTLAFDILEDSRIPRERPCQEPYMVVYGYSGRLGAEENCALRHYARVRGFRILTLGGVQECGDRFVDCDPFQLLAYFRDAEAVVTDTFHGTIFSIISNVPFVTIVRSTVGRGYGNEEKLGHLLESFGLQGRRLTRPDGLTSLLAAEADFGSVNGVLNRERRRAKEYLKAALALEAAE